MKIITLISLAVSVEYISAIALKPEWKEIRVSKEAVAESVVELLERDSLETHAIDSSTLFARDSQGSRTITPIMSNCQYTIMLKLSSYFEDPSADFYDQFAACEATSDGQGLTAGLSQFTSCSGSILQVCRNYQTLSTSKTPTFCATYLKSSSARDDSSESDGSSSTNDENGPLYNAVHNKLCFSTEAKKAFIPAGLTNFCADWSAAIKYDRDYFSTAQMMVHGTTAFESVAKVANEYNIKSPLAISQLFDISIQLGSGAASLHALGATRMAGGSPASRQEIDEARWLASLLNERRQYLIASKAPFDHTLLRVEAITRLLDRSKFNKEEIHDHLWFKGNSVTILLDDEGSSSKQFGC
ncbi:hypothetical protein BDR26DRAFT_890102 [Obelidium mucronatum]|nr:hypothetical protein BDR26DRAFT_890102 [Obelidium mucronatum]